jgi:hypothetical protein
MRKMTPDINAPKKHQKGLTILSLRQRATANRANGQSLKTTPVEY